MLEGLKNNEGITLKGGKVVEYKSGWQVADYGVECLTAQEAENAVVEFGGTCGVWLSDGVYYVDHSFRVDTKREALRIGREHKQISIFSWKRKALAYC